MPWPVGPQSARPCMVTEITDEVVNTPPVNGQVDLAKSLLKIIAGTFGIEEAALLGGDLRGDVREFLVQPCRSPRERMLRRKTRKSQPSRWKPRNIRADLTSAARTIGGAFCIRRALRSGRQSSRPRSARESEEGRTGRRGSKPAVLRGLARNSGSSSIRFSRPLLSSLGALVPGEKQNARATTLRDERAAELIVGVRGDVKRKRKLGEEEMRVVREPAAGDVEPVVERLSLEGAEPSGQLAIDSLP